MLSLYFKYLRYWNTIRYLKLSQVFYRIKFLLPNSKISQSKKNELNLLSNAWIKSAYKNQSMVSENAFEFLNETLVIKRNDWNNSNVSKLWLYNLHYFDDLNAHNSLGRKSWHFSIINRWIEENPISIGNGWEPYPTSLRIVNFIKWSLKGNILESHWVSSLEIQARFLSKNIEMHLLGNHVIANAKALIFAGLFFKGSEADEWYLKGRKILLKEIDEQILSDGGNFELSPMYHLIFLEDLLDIFNIHQVFNHTCPDRVIDKIPMMHSWIKTMCHPDEDISFFNDSSLGVAPSLKEIESYAIRLNLLSSFGGNNPKQNLINLKDSGYSRVSYGNLVALIDRASIGPDYLPAHAHADTLSFELSLFNYRLIVNSGTSVYEDSEERNRQRGTMAHSTVAIDGVNSSEVWGAFRVANRAKVFASKDLEQNKKIILSACHNGYHRMKGNPIHCRKWTFLDQLLAVEDVIEGKYDHEVDIIFPLHPLVELIEVNGNKVMLDLLGNPIDIKFDGNGLLNVEKSSYHPEFGISVENLTLHFKLNGELPLNSITTISW
tara:strand:- start:330 stop:1979 length:1650 start_codon:yes stop_codon:yes gene_type:complete